MSYVSTKKEPVSMKLRVANMKTDEVQGRTKQLEEESRKMEDRLKELKLAMNREKEQREQRGGGHWKSGKEGSLNSHAKDVLNKAPKAKPNGSGKGRKVKVLKDEPITLPVKSKEKPQPGTLAFLAQRDTSKPGLRQVGPTCGQCDIKAAVVTCQECSELYCSGCFTAFHLKGALAKHHSFPFSKIAASTPRGGSTATPRQNQSNTSKPPSTAQTRIVWEQHQAAAEKSRANISSDVTTCDSPEPQKDSLLDGDYDEREAAQSFQQALSEWRKENTDPAPLKPTVLSSTRSIKQPSARRSPTKLGTQVPNVQAVSPVHTPRVNIDEGTSTIGGSTKPSTSYQPEFCNSELSYAEKLLLKKNRRNDVPSIISGSAYSSTSLAGEIDDADIGEVVSFDAILATIQQPTMPRSPPDADKAGIFGTIIDIQEVSVDEQDEVVADTESHYMVSEEVNVSGEAGEVNGSSVDGRVFPSVKPAPTALFHKSDVDLSIYKSSRQRISSSLHIVDISDSIDVAGNDITSSVASPSPAQYTSDSKHLDVKQSVKPPAATSRPASRTNRPVSRAKRTSSRAERPISRANTSFHRGNRPRTAAEKAADMFGEGTITKRPSSAIKDVISKYKTTESAVYRGSTDYTELLGDFFTAGVKKEFKERTLTPRREKPASPGTPLKKHQMSNKVYSLSGKSWRPESSLGANVDETEVTKIYEELDNSSQMLFTDPLLSQTTPANEQTTLKYSYLASKDSASSNGGVQSVTEPVPQSLSDRLSFPADDSLLAADGGHFEHTASAIRAPSRGQSRPSSRHHGVYKEKMASSRGTSRQPMTPRSKTPLSVRSHTPIVVDGDDMTRYDDIRLPQNDNDDLDAMNDLELELASQTGRLTADGRLSRLLPDKSEDIGGDGSFNDLDLPQRSMTVTPDTQRDIDRLRESMMDDFEESELLIMQDEAMRVSLL